MIGIFDSGDGGLFALRELRRRSPNCDILFFADRKNAPYGTKSKNELIRVTTKGILKLLRAGADKVLIACCTASAHHAYLPTIIKEKSIPIIYPTSSEAALATHNGRIGVIATKTTVSSMAFTKALSEFDSVNSVFESELQELVFKVDDGARDGLINYRQKLWLYQRLLHFKEKKIDTLILGCTHFGHLEREISYLMPNIRIINSAKEGAKEIIKYSSPFGRGETVYL